MGAELGDGLQIAVSLGKMTATSKLTNPIFHQRHFIGAASGGKTMGDEDTALDPLAGLWTSGDFIYRVEYLVLSVGIQRRRLHQE